MRVFHERETALLRTVGLRMYGGLVYYFYVSQRLFNSSQTTSTRRILSWAVFHLSFFIIDAQNGSVVRYCR